MKPSIITLQNISKSFGNVYALNGVSLHVKAGEVVGSIGWNVTNHTWSENAEDYRWFASPRASQDA